MDTVNELFEEQIKDLFSAENQLLKALPKMAKKANSLELKKGFENHTRQTQEHVDRLLKIAEMWEFKPTGKLCKAMAGLIEEGKEVIAEDGDENCIDVALIAAAQRVEHYEISAYGTAKALATKLGCTETASLLDKTLKEEGETDKLLTQICETKILNAAPVEGDEGDLNDDDDDDEEE